MIESPLPGKRLDSWKAIAEYLHRDLATVRRWEKTLGLPVRRVGGTGRSVFAHSAEIDRWLETARPVLPDRAGDPLPITPNIPTRGSVWPWLGLAAAVLAAATALFAGAGRMTAEDLRVEATSEGVIARDSAGVEQWRHRFPAFFETSPVLVQVTGGARPGVYFSTLFRSRRGDREQIESGELTLLDIKGNPQRSFSFVDQVTFASKRYGPPWGVTEFAITDTENTRRLAVAARHYAWDPGIVTILDEQWQRRGTFVHAGWIEAVSWIGPERLLIGGFSNARDGGMIALLDGRALDGQGPEPPGSRHFCETCGTDRPLRMFVFPRAEVNLITASRFNRVHLQTTAAGNFLARTIEMAAPAGDADALYEFTPSLDFVSARFSDRYWEMHRALETAGKIGHTREQCPDREGPRQVQEWKPETGWRTVALR